MMIRLIGVRVSNFVDPYVQDGLFDDDQAKRTESIHQAVDKIKDRYGEKAIRQGIYK